MMGLTKDERMAFWREVYIAVIGSRGNSAARESADEAVRDLVTREKIEEEREN